MLSLSIYFNRSHHKSEQEHFFRDDNERQHNKPARLIFSGTWQFFVETEPIRPEDDGQHRVEPAPRIPAPGKEPPEFGAPPAAADVVGQGRRSGRRDLVRFELKLDFFRPFMTSYCYFKGYLIKGCIFWRPHIYLKYNSYKTEIISLVSLFSHLLPIIMPHNSPWILRK